MIKTAIGEMVSLWKKQPGQFFCVSTKSATKRWTDRFFDKTEFSEALEYATRNAKGKDVYMCPHGFARPQRSKPNAVDPNLLYADLDHIDPRTLEIKPTIAIESSPGRFVAYWFTDSPASEDLNRRLTYMLGADKSGWDRTQVLRVPGTRNYKYETAPEVKLLWTNGPKYEVAKLEKVVPVHKALDESTINSEASAIYKRYESKLPRPIRRELVHGRPTPGKRSEVLWKLQNACLEAGMSRDEAFAILWASPWNKFRDRKDGADQLWRELDKSLDQHFTGYAAKGAEDADDKSFKPLMRSIAEVQAENIVWVAHGFLARRELSILEGDPGLGKSYLMQWIAGHICDGTPLPFIEKKYTPKPGKVCYFDIENTMATVTKVRLVENGVKNLHNFFQCDEPFSVDNEDRWNAVLERLDELRPDLVVFDPINLYIGGADTYKSSETQQALAMFKDIAVRYDCAVVLLRHLTKGSKDKALYRGQGSIAFTGAARIVASGGWHPEEEGLRVIACTKNNLASPFKSFSYDIEALPDTLKQQNRSKLTYEGFVDYDSEEIVGAVRVKDPGTTAIAADLIREMLAGGVGVNAQELYKAAEGRSISERTLQRAASNLEVKKETTGKGATRQTIWYL
jgi:hypothetical protein